MIATIVDTKVPGIPWSWPFVAGVGTTIAFSLAIFGASRVAEANRDANRFRATTLGALTVVGLLATGAAVVAAVVVMTAK